MLEASPLPARWELYRVLSEPVRLRLLALADEEELAIGELAELLDESQPNVSRHAAPLRQVGLLVVRREGTRTLVRVPDEVKHDPVIADALASGRALCLAEGRLRRVADVLRARDQLARDFFARKGGAAPGKGEGYASELGMYLSALAPLLPRRALAVDAGTGDGGLLDVLAPVYERVVGIDRSGAQLDLARERVALRGYTNVALVEGELDGDEARRAVGEGADAVFASRLLHHASRPAQVVEELAALAAPGGAVVVLDYAEHDDESMREQADLWLGFAPEKLERFARDAGLEGARVMPIPRGPEGARRSSPDAHLAWQMLIAHTRTEKRGKRHG